MIRSAQEEVDIVSSRIPAGPVDEWRQRRRRSEQPNAHRQMRVTTSLIDGINGGLPAGNTALQVMEPDRVRGHTSGFDRCGGERSFREWRARFLAPQIAHSHCSAIGPAPARMLRLRIVHPSWSSLAYDTNRRGRSNPHRADRRYPVAPCSLDFDAGHAIGATVSTYVDVARRREPPEPRG